MQILRKVLRHPLFILFVSFFLTSYSVGMSEVISWLRYALLFQMPLWTVIAITLLALVTVAAIKQLRTLSSSIEYPPYVNYLTDLMYGVTWKWKWAKSYKHDLDYCVSDDDLFAYCPLCQMKLDGSNSYNYDSEANYVCENDSCSWEWSTNDKPTRTSHYSQLVLSHQEIKSKVVKQIERKARTGEWRSK